MTSIFCFDDPTTRLFWLFQRDPGMAVVGADEGLAVGGFHLPAVIYGDLSDVTGVGNFHGVPLDATIPRMDQSGVASARPDLTTFGDNDAELDLRILRVNFMPLAKVSGVDQFAVRSDAPVDFLR